jgi:two-component system cell cycle response regulator DivK
MERTILVVDDYEDVRGFMKFYLELHQFKVYEANNGQEAIEIAKIHRPDLILMDISMPDMDGLTATRLIRELGDGISKTPIIALTAFGENFEEPALNAGCDYFLEKPVNFDQLDSAIKKYIVE